MLDDSVLSDPPRYQHLPTTQGNCHRVKTMDICLQRQTVMHRKCKLYILKVFVISHVLYNLSNFSRKHSGFDCTCAHLWQNVVLLFSCAGDVPENGVQGHRHRDRHIVQWEMIVCGWWCNWWTAVCSTECGEHDVVKQRYFLAHCKLIGERERGRESPHPRGGRKSISLLVGSLASPARPSDRSSIKVNTLDCDSGSLKCGPRHFYCINSKQIIRKWVYLSLTNFTVSPCILIHWV
jgi:hypothetical protein